MEHDSHLAEIGQPLEVGHARLAEGRVHPTQLQCFERGKPPHVGGGPVVQDKARQSRKSSSRFIPPRSGTSWRTPVCDSASIKPAQFGSMREGRQVVMGQLDSRREVQLAQLRQGCEVAQAASVESGP